MTKQTASLSLSKPEITDKIVDTITQLASNFDVIDSSLADKTTRLSNLVVDVKADYGAKGDGVTDDSTSFQNAINYVNSKGGGTVWIPFSTSNYLLNSPIIMKNGVILKSCGGSRGSGGAKVKAGHNGIMFSDQANSSTAFIGLNFEGFTSAQSVPTTNAIKTVSGTKIEACSFNFFAGSAVVLGGVASTIQDVICTNCVYDRTVSVKTGGIHVGGTDHYLINIEANVGSGHTDVTTNKNAVSLYIEGSNHFVTNCIGEFGEVGIYISASKCRVTGSRADRNMGDGFIVTGSQNIFTNCHAMENGTATTNTYDGFQVTGNLNLFVGCSYSNQGTSVVRYGFNDTIQSATQKNEYFGCNVSGTVGTSKFKNDNFLGSGFAFGNGWYRITSGTVIDVSGINNLELYYGPATITSFTGGVNGQQIKLISYGSITIQNNAGIKTNTVADKLLATNKIYTFTNMNGVWIENA